MSPIIPSKYGHPKYNVFPQKSRATSLGGLKGASQRGTPGSDSKSRRKQRIEESKVTVQPSEDDDGDNFYSKHLAAARFQRNHRLINILFSDVVVDLEQPSDNDKLNGCRKRVKSLTDYQKKIDDEIAELNDRFSAKRVKIIDDGQKFAAKLSEFISNSKKELEALKIEHEVRRQKELKEQAIRLQARQDLLKDQAASSSTSMDVDDPTKANEKQTLSDKSNEDEIRIVLDGIVDSVTNTI